ncbi:signal peptide peptidase SppA [Leptospira sp. GIMC2001]|uniref:signal peptide peptidase SppA n=1 Tax=Leptospira sp. GIMC2001 TaxID=1513297 RepID=UPI00300E29E1
MEKNKLILLLSFFLALAGSLIGILNIGLYSTSNRYAASTGTNFFQSPQVSAVLIKIEGEIHSGRSTYSSTGSDTILSRLREVGEMPNVKGILVEINSPGGTVAASQEIYNELMFLRKSKKIVVSMKDVAASGGYYIASAADSIFAESGTLTGSIGVIAVSPNIKGLMDRYGVEMRVFKAGKYKDSLSPFRDSTDEEVNMMNKLLKDNYNKFIEDISKGRNRTVASIEELAEGKIYSGEDAFRNKLVDDIGGRREALVKLSELCQYEGEIPLLEESESPIDRFMQSIGGSVMGLKMIGKVDPIQNFWQNNHSPILLMLPSAIRLPGDL